MPAPDEQVKEIKRALRSLMDGVTAQSLRQKGCSSKVVWGASIQHLRSLAGRYEPNAELAEMLWQSDVRECKILATMLMPVNEVDTETANRWLSETVDEEIAELLVFNLLQHLSFAQTLATKWLDTEKFIPRLAALNLFGRLFMRRNSFNNSNETNDLNEPDGAGCAGSAEKFVHQAVDCLTAESPALRRAAMNALIRFAETNAENRAAAVAATNSAGFDFL